jgi:hypothetical protein
MIANRTEFAVECFGYFLRGSLAAEQSTNHSLVNYDFLNHTFVDTVEHRNGGEQVLGIVLGAARSVAQLSSAVAEIHQPTGIPQTEKYPLGSF